MSWQICNLASHQNSQRTQKNVVLESPPIWLAGAENGNDQRATNYSHSHISIKNLPKWSHPYEPPQNAKHRHAVTLSKNETMRSPGVSLASLAILGFLGACLAWTLHRANSMPTGGDPGFVTLGFIFMSIVWCSALLLVSTVLAAIAIVRRHRFRWITTILLVPVLCIFCYWWTKMLW